MATALSGAQLQDVSAQLSAHPEILQAFKAYSDWASHRGRLAYVQKGGPPNPQEVLKQYGINFPDIEDYQIQVDPAGNVGLKRENWLQRNMDWVLPVSVIGGGAAVGALAGGGGAAATTPAVTSGAAGPLAAGETFAAGPIAGTGIEGGAAAAAPTVASVGSGSLLHSLLPTIIGAGASLGGTAIASHANSEAAKIAAAQADKALAVQQQQYALQRQDTAPYRALGQGAVNNLGFLSGIDTTSNLKALSDINPTVNPPPSTGVAPGAVDASGKPIPGAPPTSSITPPTMAQQQTNNKTLSQVGGGGTVRIQDPATGMVHLIPQSDAAAAQQAGGRLV